MRVQRCKGSRDLTPERMLYFRFVEKAFRKCCLKWGYEEVKTPVLEYLHLFTSVGTLTPDMLGRVYSFLDWDGWSGQRLVLRPDGTIPVARMYIDSMGDRKPARLFYTSNIFRFEETGQESRERWQGGVELVGAGSNLADVELIAMSLDALGGMGINNVELKLSHAGLLKGMLSALGLSEKERVEVFDRFLDGDKEALSRIDSGGSEINRTILSVLGLEGKAPGFLRNLRALFSDAAPSLLPLVDDFMATVELLDALGREYTIDLTSGRGFEYYTGMVFQLYKGNVKVGGGGRYDDLIPMMGGGDTPASGFALYFDCLMEMVENPGWNEAMQKRILVKTGLDSISAGFDISDRLRSGGYTAELMLENQDLTHIRWLLEVRSSSPLYILRDRVEKRDYEIESAGEVIELLGEVNADKDSPS
ncbi:MAG: HisS family protein [Dehalococcoidales bacterium]